MSDQRLFQQTFLVTEKSLRDRWVIVALGLQAVAVTALALLPLTSIENIAPGNRFTILPPRAHAPREPTNKPPSQTSSAAPNQPRLARLPASTLGHPVIIPHLGALNLDSAPLLAPSGGFADSLNAGGLGSAITGFTVPEARPAPPSPVIFRPRKPVAVGSVMAQARLVSGPKPVYPRLAVTARISGVVKLQAIIDREGNIRNLHYLSGQPMLVGAAMEAVQRWKYRPLLLNGEPVEVITEIDVNFTLTQ